MIAAIDSAPGVAALLGEQAIEALHRPTAQAAGLPGLAYCSPEFYEMERRTVFYRSWTAAAMASEIPNAGDVLPVEVAGWPLAFVRGGDGKVRCFHNICRHRGAAVVTEAASAQPALRCPWHAWTYGLDGSLRGTPEFGGVGCHDAEGLDRSRSGLLPVRIGQWFDFLFVNLSGDALPLDEHLAPLRSRFASAELSRWLPGGSWTSTYPGNWKLSVESGIEDLHVPWLHPQLADGPNRGEACGVELGGECYFGTHMMDQRWAAGRGSVDLPPLPKLPGLEGDDAKSLLFLNIFPSGVMGLTPDSMYAATWLPDGVERTRLRFHHYFAAQAMDERLAVSRRRVIAAVQEAAGQDAPVIAQAQARSRTRDGIGLRTCFSPFWETAVHAFQKRVVDAMRE